MNAKLASKTYEEVTKKAVSSSHKLDRISKGKKKLISY